MPRSASTAQRIRWHLEHATACACRPIPAKLQEEIARRGSRPTGGTPDSADTFG